MAADAYWSNVVLHMPLNSTARGIEDIKGRSVTPIGGAAISAAQGRFAGEGSLYLNGTSQKLDFASSLDFNFGAGPVTYEFSIYPLAYPAAGRVNRLFMVGTNGSTYGQTVSISDVGVLYIGKPLGGTSATATASGVVVLNAWNDFEIVAENTTTVRIFKAGVLVAGPGSLTMQTAGTAVTLRIGYDSSGFTSVDEKYYGYISHIRITQSARHSAAFSPITGPLARPEIKGVVTNSVGAPVAKAVQAWKRSTSALVGSAISDATTGEYTINCQNYTDELVVAQFDQAVLPLTDGSVSSYASIKDRVVAG